MDSDDYNSTSTKNKKRPHSGDDNKKKVQKKERLTAP